MKLILTAIILVSLTACGGGGDESPVSGGPDMHISDPKGTCDQLPPELQAACVAARS